MKAKLLLSSILFALSLTACVPAVPNSEDANSKPFDTSTAVKVEASEKILAPQGAPAIAFYDQGKNDNFTTNGNIENIKSQLVNDEYGMIVVDFFGGLSYSAQNKGHYKLAKILTGGNLYLVGIGDNNTGKPTEGKKVVAFGQNSLPALVFENLYPELKATTNYVGAVKDIAPVLTAGKFKGEAVDYVVIAQPLLFKVSSNDKAPTYGKLHVIESLRDHWEQKTGQKAIPQAGLFVNSKQYEDNKDYFDEQFGLIEERIDTAISDFAKVKKTMDEQIPSLDDQAKRFGFNSGVVMKVQGSKDTPNGFALVSSIEEPTISIEKFLTSVGKNNPAFADYIL